LLSINHNICDLSVNQSKVVESIAINLKIGVVVMRKKNFILVIWTFTW